MSLTVPTKYGEVAVTLSGREPGAAPTLLLFHANPGDARDFDAVAPKLGEEWAVAGVDWPGYGGSTATGTATEAAVTASALGEIAVDVLDALVAGGHRDVSVLGSSIGGYAAVRLAERRPDLVRSVVLVAPAGFTPQNALIRAYCRFMARRRVARAVVGPFSIAYLGGLRSASAKAAYRRAKGIKDDPAALASYTSIWRSAADERIDLVTARPRLAMPVLVVWGWYDPINPAPLNLPGVRRALPTARVVVLAAAHEPYNDVPDRFLASALPFLREHAVRSA